MSKQLYTEALGERICDELAKGKTLRTICELDGMPDERTIRRWASDLDHPFAPQYAHARELGYQQMADDLIDIADGKSVAWTQADADKEDEAVDRDGAIDPVQRDRLRVDTRKWLLSKALPKIYGDRIATDTTHTFKFSDEFEKFVRDLNERGSPKVINGSVAAEGERLVALAEPVRS